MKQIYTLITALVIGASTLMAQEKKTETVVLGLDSPRDMLGGLVGGNFQDNKHSFFESILDADNDGSVLDDVAGAVLGEKKTGLGGLLGKLFNKK